MVDKKPDCTWCGSARSIEYGVCQVCLMGFPITATVLRLPLQQAKEQRVEPVAPRTATSD